MTVSLRDCQASRLIATLAVAFFILAGCQTLKDNRAVTLLGIDQATLRVIERADDPQQRAQRIADIAVDAIAFVSAEEMATVDTVLSLVTDRAQWDKLSVADERLVRQLINLAAAEISERIESGIISETDKVFVIDVLTTIESAALYYLDQTDHGN